MPAARVIAAGAIVLVGCFEAYTALAGQPIPDRWRKTMTNNPSSNPFLTKYATPMENKTEEAGRVVMLVGILGHLCQGSSIVGANYSAFIQKSGLPRKTEADRKTISDDVGERFNGFDYETLAHLCSGIEYLFGAQGALGHDLITPGTGEPTIAYDPDNPYLRLPPLFKNRD